MWEYNRKLQRILKFPDEREHDSRGCCFVLLLLIVNDVKVKVWEKDITNKISLHKTDVFFLRDTKRYFSVKNMWVLILKLILLNEKWKWLEN